MNTEWKFSYRIPNTNTGKYQTTNIEYEYSLQQYQIHFEDPSYSRIPFKNENGESSVKD